MRLATVTVILSSPFISSLRFSLTVFSITSLQLLLSFVVVLHSPPTLSRSLLTQSCRRILGPPRLRFPSTFWTSVLFADSSSPILSPRAAHSFQPTPHQLLLKPVIHSNLHSQFIQSSVIRSHTSSYPVVLFHFHFLLLLLWQYHQFEPLYMCWGNT